MMSPLNACTGLVIAIVRGRTGEETLARAYEREKVDIPRAPGLGLLLENVRNITQALLILITREVSINC